MWEATEGQPSTRVGRCSNHPAISAVGTCDVCGKRICLSCAIPVRERLVCHDCLATVLIDVPTGPRPPVKLPLAGTGDRLAVAGFALVVLLSAFPWTRFGDHAGFFEAWTPHWSLVTVGAAAAGLAFALWAWRRPIDPRITAGVYVALAAVVGGGAILHRRHPPGSPLSAASTVSRLAILCAAIALLGGLIKAASLMRRRRLRIP